MAEKHKAQLDVEEFHRAVGLPVNESPALLGHPWVSLRAELIMEEAIEAVQAATGLEVDWCYTERPDEPPDLVGAIDGLVDLLVVTYGAAVEWGINLAPFWDEVHRTNMLKKGGPRRGDGKVLKPEGWEPPQIARILEGGAVTPDSAQEEER